MPTGIFTLKQVELALGQGAWTNQKPLTVDYLVVAGGGAGGGGYGGGGGAGGLLQGNLPVTTGSAITVTVGGGGTGSSGNGTNGSNSVFSAITTTGGGGGPGGQQPGASGGSGGGSGGNPAGRWGQGVFNQGNRGGDGGSGTGPALGGGGGAGTRGSDAYGEGPAGYGGTGVASDISGTRTAYAGGGGSGVYLRNAVGFNGIGGAGGGGAGGDSSTSTSGTPGTANTGGGGGGASYGGSGSPTGGNGGSGIVIISYPDTYAAAVSTTGSPTVSTSGSGSIALSGSGSYLTYAANAALTNFGTGSFTIETWVYVNSATSFAVVTGGNGGAGQWYLEYSSNRGFVVYDGVANITTSVSTALTGQWVHLAVVRNGSSAVTLYQNGVSVGTGSSTQFASTFTLAVGAYSGGSSGLNGYISNLRIVKGSAVYTSAFTPSTAPLTAITNTQLLLNAVSGAFLADSSTNGFAPNSSISVSPTWNQLSPFATGLGYKNRVYTWTSSGSITF